MRTLLLISLSLLAFCAWSQQATFEVVVSNDSVLLGNTITARFTIENANTEDLSLPAFSGFHVSGPSVSTQMSMMNGAVSQSTTYTYYLEPQEVGEYYIEPASIKTEDGFLETLPVAVNVFPNPDGIIQSPPSNNSGIGAWPGNSLEHPFFQRDLFSDDFFGQNLMDDPFFKQLFEFDPNSGLPRGTIPNDSIPEPPRKKRKTTRL